MDRKIAKIKYCIYLSAFAVILISGAAVGSEISLTGSVDKTDIAFEDSVKLTVEIKWLGDISSYNFQVLPLPEAENLKVTGTSSSISSKTGETGDITVRTFKYVLRPTGSGVATIDPVVLDYLSFPDSTTGQLSTQEFKILVAARIPRGNETNLPLFAKILIGLAALVVIGGVVIFVRKYKAVDIEPVKTSEEEFLEGLETARKESQNDRKQFFTRLYKLLMMYLEGKYGLELSGKTAQSIVEQLDSIDLQPIFAEKVGQWLIQADKEKFAPGAGAPGDTLRLATEIDKTFREQMS